MRVVGASVGVIAIALLASGCHGANHAYARYQDREAATPRIETLVSTIPQYPGARRSGSQYFGTGYHLPSDDFIEAEPYSSALYYDLDRTVSGATLQRYFRRVMHARGWSCRFRHRAPGVPYGFGCVLHGATVSAYIADHGHYELDVAADHARPPIPTVPGD